MSYRFTWHIPCHKLDLHDAQRVIQIFVTKTVPDMRFIWYFPCPTDLRDIYHAIHKICISHTVPCTTFIWHRATHEIKTTHIELYIRFPWHLPCHIWNSHLTYCAIHEIHMTNAVSQTKFTDIFRVIQTIPLTYIVPHMTSPWYRVLYYP